MFSDDNFDEEEHEPPVLSDVENKTEHLMSNLMQAAIKRSGVSLVELPATHFGDTVIEVPQQTEAVAQNDTEGLPQVDAFG